jgi:hypothetical protein
MVLFLPLKASPNKHHLSLYFISQEAGDKESSGLT